MNTKQVIVVRNDLPWKKFPGKLAVQVSHASKQFFVQATRSGLPLTPEQKAWRDDPESNQATIVVKVANEVELLEILQKAKDGGLTVYSITDAGRTVFPEPTMTCVAIGPHRVESFGLTSHLSLMY